MDAILHAGDIGGQLVRVTIGNRRILLTHIFRPELLEQEADVIVFGHSHRPHNEVIDGVLLFNPASAGPRRFKLPVMLGMIEGKRAYHVALDGRSKTALTKCLNHAAWRER